MKKIGIVAMSNISQAGGYPRAVRDLINALTKLGKQVYLTTPFKLNYKKIEKYYGQIHLEKVYNLNKFRTMLCKEEKILSRKLIIKEFRKMAKEVDIIIDIDRGVLHKYLPKDFDKSKYIIWRLSPACLDFEKFPNLPRSPKRKIKDFIKKILTIKKTAHSKKYKIYPLDEWTRNELIQYYNFKPEEFCLYPEIQTDKILFKPKKKKNKIVVLGRIAQNKFIDDAVKVFALGTKKHPEYELIILGGATKDSEYYIKKLRSIAKKFKVDKKVKIIKNPPFKKLKEVLEESKILINAQRGDSVNLTTVEAIAAGCVILATKNDSGTWLGTLEKGKHGFGFSNNKEGGEQLNIILDKLKTRKLNVKKLSKRAEFYSEKKFIERVKEILDRTEKTY